MLINEYSIDVLDIEIGISESSWYELRVDVSKKVSGDVIIMKRFKGPIFHPPPDRPSTFVFREETNNFFQVWWHSKLLEVLVYPQINQSINQSISYRLFFIFSLKGSLQDILLHKTWIKIYELIHVGKWRSDQSVWKNPEKIQSWPQIEPWTMRLTGRNVLSYPLSWSSLRETQSICVLTNVWLKWVDIRSIMCPEKIDYLHCVAQCKGIRKMFACGIRNLGVCCLGNPESLALESGIHL